MWSFSGRLKIGRNRFDSGTLHCLLRDTQPLGMENVSKQLRVLGKSHYAISTDRKVRTPGKGLTRERGGIGKQWPNNPCY